MFKMEGVVIRSDEDEKRQFTIESKVLAETSSSLMIGLKGRSFLLE